MNLNSKEPWWALDADMWWDMARVKIMELGFTIDVLGPVHAKNGEVKKYSLNNDDGIKVWLYCYWREMRGEYGCDMHIVCGKTEKFEMFDLSGNPESEQDKVSFVSMTDTVLSFLRTVSDSNGDRKPQNMEIIQSISRVLDLIPDQWEGSGDMIHVSLVHIIRDLVRMLRKKVRTP